MCIDRSPGVWISLEDYDRSLALMKFQKDKIDLLTQEKWDLFQQNEKLRTLNINCSRGWSEQKVKADQYKKAKEAAEDEVTKLKGHLWHQANNNGNLVQQNLYLLSEVDKLRYKILKVALVLDESDDDD